MNKFLRGLVLIILAIALSAEKETYEKINIPKASVDVIKIICAIIAAIITSYSIFGIRKKIIKRQIKSLSEVIFSKKDPNGTYRVTCFKYVTPAGCAWYRVRNFWLAKRKGYSDRKMDKWLKGYLICYARYSYKKGEVVTNNSSISFLIDENRQDNSKSVIKGFAGQVFVSKGQFEIALNVGIVNETVKKLRDDRDLYDAFTRDDKKYNSTEADIIRLNSSPGVIRRLTSDEMKQVKEFMRQTNTNLFELMTINNGVHANHFLGFKVYNSDNDLNDKKFPWGVITIDAFDENDFEIISSVKTQSGNLLAPSVTLSNVNWINVFLSSFTRVFANIGDL